MAEQVLGVVESQASDGDISSPQNTLMIGFAKLGLTALTVTLLLGVRGALAICPCGDGICGGATCLPRKPLSLARKTAVHHPHPHLHLRQN